MRILITTAFIVCLSTAASAGDNPYKSGTVKNLAVQKPVASHTNMAAPKAAPAENEISSTKPVLFNHGKKAIGKEAGNPTPQYNIW